MSDTKDEGVVVRRCVKCEKSMSPEELFVNAIFGDKSMCKECYEIEKSPKCIVCGEPTALFVNGVPMCHGHAYQD